MTRNDWLSAMLRIAGPVLVNLAEGRLRETLPTVFHPDRADFTHLEAFGRTVCGIAPWLELDGLTGEEAEIQAHYREITRKALRMAVDPDSPDHMNFSNGYGQALVDAAFLAHGVVRAPKQLGECLDAQTRKLLVRALRDTRVFTPFVCNWLLFSAMIEAALFVLGEADCDMTRVDYAVNMHQSWYKGDGLYGDGPEFHWDYYNSFVIHPMLLDVVRVFKDKGRDYGKMLPGLTERSARYAAILERLIAPDGTYPIIGRSITYRFGAFQLLSQAALQGFLPEDVAPAQVRCGLSAVIARTLSGPMFDENGWLLPGVYGEQPGLAEGYISTGSLYLCESVFLPLGLAPDAPFWRDADMPWTSKKLWAGADMPCDHALE